MNPQIWETMLINLPSLTGFIILSWYLLLRLKACEEARDVLQKEHSDLLVRITRLEERQIN